MHPGIGVVENHHLGGNGPVAGAMVGNMDRSPIRYTVRFPAPGTHYAEVEAEIPTEGRESVELFMAVWTPGSYLVREYARHVEMPPEFAKSRKNRWRVETGGAPTVRIRYRVYCREMSVRTNWVEADFALLNGAPTFVTLVDGHARPHEVRLELPEAWKTTMTGLDAAPGGAPHHYVAPDYDTLVDSPILAGNPEVHQFEVDGIPHFLVHQGGDGVWDAVKSATNVEKIVLAYRGMWGSLPYSKYVFLNLLTEAGGGLEHRNSVVMMASRWAARTRKAYLSWLGLVSHEFFHVWNVKRLRPVELGPFDYENENHTTSLWVAEGITEYYAPVMVHRAALSTREELLAEVSNNIESIQNTPGRLFAPLERSSYDAWIKLYRPDENSKNTTVSYYTKGAVVGWLLDAAIRKASGGAKSLDDAMRLAFERYSGDLGYTPQQFKATCGEVAGASLREFFRHAVESTEELDYVEALDWLGLRFRPVADSGKAWLGATTRVDGGRLLVSQIPRGTPAFGILQVDDEILGIGDFRVRPDQLAQRLENYQPSEATSILVARREKLLRIDIVLGPEPANLWQLEVLADVTADQRHQLDAWLGL